MPIDPVVVDAHSHVFNAEDLPIDGFLKELIPAPRFLSGLVTQPLDLLTAWLAPGPSNEAGAIAALLSGTPGGFSVAAGSPWAIGSDLGVPEPAPAGFVGDDGVPSGIDAEIAAVLAELDADERAELREWYEQWGEGDAEAPAGFGLPSWLDPIKIGASIRRNIGALKLITRFRYLVATDLATTYPDVELFVPALVDFTAATRDRPATKVRDQVRIHSLVSKLSIAGKLPGAERTRIHPMVGFDPLREIDTSLLGRWKPTEGFPNRYVPYGNVIDPDEIDRYRPGMTFDPARARPLNDLPDEWNERVPNLDGVMRSLDIVRHAIEQGGFVGVKVYPPAGFLPLGNHLRFPGDHGERLDVAMRALYAYCVAMDVPILTHAAHSNGFKGGYDALAGPAGWELVLSEFPDLRVCLGHFGHLHAIGEDPGRPLEHSWPSRFVQLIDRYPNVYADVGNSKVPASDGYRDRFGQLLQHFLGGDDPNAEQQKRRRRVLYGSDWWMNVRNPCHQQFLESFRELMEERFDAATVDAFMGLNALRWLGFIDDADELDLQNRNRSRLVDFYGPHPTPRWLAPAT